MTHEAYKDEDLASLLSSVRTIAVVGASPNPVRASFIVIKYLIGKGYDVHPVNPGIAGGEILGRKVYASLAELPANVDMLDIFRNADAAMGIVQDAVAEKERLGLKVVWMQLGVRNDMAAELAEAAGLSVVMNRCPKLEYGRLSGEIGWLGINSGRLTSKRPLLSPAGVQSLKIKAGS